MPLRKSTSPGGTWKRAVSPTSNRAAWTPLIVREAKQPLPRKPLSLVKTMVALLLGDASWNANSRSAGTRDAVAGDTGVVAQPDTRL
jgi:hypothetical protein